MANEQAQGDGVLIEELRDLKTTGDLLEANVEQILEDLKVLPSLATKEQVDRVELRLGAMENRLGGVENRLGAMENRLSALESQFQSFTTLIQEIFKRLMAMAERLSAIEGRLGLD